LGKFLHIKECLKHKVKHFPLAAQGEFNGNGRNPLCLQGFFAMSALEDGTYDGVVVDVDEGDDDTIAIEVAISSGDHKGEVVRVRAARRGDGALTLLGLPVVLRVDGETIGVRVDRS
jgi:hypothetical protein